jgi:anti-sigma factor RsiW
MRDECERTGALLERYFDGELRERATQYVEDHLADCPRCAKELQALQEMRGLIQTSIRDAVAQAAQAELSRVWQGIEPHLEAPKPSFWERMGVAAREYFSVYKSIWATAAAAAAVAALVAVPLLLRSGPTVEIAKSQSNECIIESIESSGSTAMVYDLEQDQIKVIWMFEDPEDPSEGPSSL